MSELSEPEYVKVSLPLEIPTETLLQTEDMIPDRLLDIYLENYQAGTIHTSKVML